MKGNQQAMPETATNNQGLSRRKFFGLAGGFVAAGLAIGTTSSCNNTDVVVNYSSDDLGLFNYYYTLQQISIAVLYRIKTTPFNGITDIEQSMLSEMYYQDMAQAAFFKAVVKNGLASDLDFDFRRFDFSSRESVLTNFKIIKDMIVGAYNGSIQYFSNNDYAVTAAKMSSVQARHAAYVRNLLLPESFADYDVIDNTNGMDITRSPKDTMKIAGQYCFTQIEVNNLPTV